jgi:hypothetical protein
MRKAWLLALVLLAQGASSRGVRPLRPQELAVVPYQEIVTASLTGSLMDEGGCLLFRDDATKQHYLPVWPIGSIYNGTSVIFHQPAKADQRLVIGEEFLMEGRPVQWSALDAAYYEPFRRQCGTTPFLVTAIRPAN